MSVVKTVGKGMAWNTAATVIGKVLIFANVFLILAHLSVYEYGFSELILSIVAMGSVVLLPGLTTTITADLSVERARGNTDRMSGIFHQFFFLQMTLGLLVWSILFFAAGPIAVFAGNALAGHFLTVISFIFLVTPLRTMSGVLAAVMLRFFDQSFYGVFEELFKFMIILVTIVWLRMGVIGLMYAILFSQLLTMLVYLPRTVSAYRTFSHASAPDRMHFWNLFGSHRKWSIGASYIGSFAMNIRIWIIKLMLGTEAVGLFSFAYGIFAQVVSLMPLSTVLAPVVPRYIDKLDQLVRIIRASIKLQLTIAVVFGLCMVVFAKPFVVIFFPKYLSAVPLIYILAVGLISNSIITLFTPVFAAFKEQKSLLFSNVLKLILGTVFLPPAILMFGMYGTAIEVVLTTLINGIERYYRLQRVVRGFSISLGSLFMIDAYEREAMQTVIGAVRTRLFGSR